MIPNDEIVLKLKEDLRRIVESETESLKDRIAAARAQFVETMSRLEVEVESTSAPLLERLENQLLQTMDPLLTFPGLFAQEQAELSARIENLKGEMDRLEPENARLREQNMQLSDQVSGVMQELSLKSDLLERMSQERQQMDERVAGMVEEYAQAKANASRSTRVMLQRLLASLEEIEGKKSQVDILTAFLDEAAQFASRVALFVAKGDLFSGWRSHGFHSDSFNDADVRAIHFPVQGETALQQSFEDRRVVLATRMSQPGNGEVLDRLGSPLKDSFVVIPLVVKEKSTAVLYADAGLDAEGALDFEALELLVRLVALSVELLAYRARTVLPQQPGVRVVAVPAEQAAVEPAAPPSQPEGPPTPSVAPPQAEASQPECFKPSQIPEPAERPQPLSPTAVSPSPLESMKEPIRSAPAIYPPLQEAPAPPPVNEHEVKLHNDAKRFARLLVSEIKLYNEQKVQEGRKNRDLYERLKEDIDRSREMYMKRVSPVVSQSVDYFYDELVRTLGENDPDALGSDCPGPMITATT